MKYRFFLFGIVTSILLLGSHAQTVSCFTHNNNTPQNQTNDSCGFSVSIHNVGNQRGGFSQFQSGSCPNYTAEEIGVIFCSSWGVADFAHAFNDFAYEAMLQGKSRADVENEALGLYHYYCIPAFVDYIKTFSGYRGHIKTLYAGLIIQKGKFYKLRRALNFVNSTYAHKLDLYE